MTEAEIQHGILLAIGGRPDVRLWRNNTGQLLDRRGVPVRFGLKGSADLLGLLRTGQFLAIEVKGPHGRLTAEQEAFGRMVQRFNGLFVVARSVEEAVRAINGALGLKPEVGGEGDAEAR